MAITRGLALSGLFLLRLTAAVDPSAHPKEDQEEYHVESTGENIVLRNDAE